MSLEESIRRHYLPKQAELTSSRFGTLASMICGPSDAEMRSQSERWKKRKGEL